MPSYYANLLLVSADTLARKPNMYSSSSSDDSSSNGTGSSSNDCLRDFLFPDPPPFPPPTLMPLTTPPLPLSPLIGEVPTAEGCCYASAAVYHTQVNLIEDSMDRFTLAGSLLIVPRDLERNFMEYFRLQGSPGISPTSRIPELESCVD